MISKNIENKEIVLKSSEIYINGQSIPKDSLKPLLTQDKNNFFF